MNHCQGRRLDADPDCQVSSSDDKSGHPIPEKEWSQKCCKVSSDKEKKENKRINKDSRQWCAQNKGLCVPQYFETFHMRVN